MVNKLHLAFLRNKIAELRSALLFSLSKSVLKIPAGIVDAFNVDDMGFIWLMMHRPVQDIKEFERNFPVKLNFYQKGKEFYLNIEGKATIVLEPAEIEEMLEHTSFVNRSILDEWMLVKVEITDAEYYGMMPASPNHGWISNISAHFNKMFSSQHNYHKSLAIH